jgi:flavin reductase (DIM6/NTAB) family NADH-FMN oxidoreductase RutF
MVTGVGLITTYTEKRMENVMAAEWTMNVSYDPPLILVVIHRAEATHEMIMESKEFGVNVAADDQGALVSLAGSFTRYETDKMSSEIIRTYPSKKIKAPMVEGCVVNAECKLVKTVELGEYTGFIGEVLEATHNPQKRPFIYHRSKLWRIQDSERQPTLFVTATHVQGIDVVRAEGRMRGGDMQGKIELTLLRNGERIDQGIAAVDQRGFYKYEWPMHNSDGQYTVQARSGPLFATASLRKMVMRKRDRDNDEQRESLVL